GRGNVDLAEELAREQIALQLGDQRGVVRLPFLERNEALEDSIAHRIGPERHVAEAIALARVARESDVRRAAVEVDVDSLRDEAPVEIAALAREDVDQALEAQIVAVTKRAALAERKGVEQRREPGVVLGLAADVELHVADDHGRARVDRHPYLPTIVPGRLERRVDRRVVAAGRPERGA